SFLIAFAVLFPADGRTILAVKIRVQLFAGAKVLLPAVPGFLLLGKAARAVTADQQTKHFVRVSGVVPAFGLDRHGDEPIASVYSISSRSSRCQASRSRAGSNSGARRSHHFLSRS